MRSRVQPEGRPSLHRRSTERRSGDDQPPRGILFDKDGTLIDFRATWLTAYRAIADDLARLAGLPLELAPSLLARMGYHHGDDRFDETSPLLWATNETIAALWAAEPELAGWPEAPAIIRRHLGDAERYPPVAVGDLPDLFARLGARGLALGVATMDNTAHALDTVRRLGIADSLDFLTGCDGGHGEKPGPGMVLGFCAATGLRPEQVLVVGDTAADLEMARAAGAAAAVAVLTGAAPREMLDALADHVLPSVMQIESLL